MHGGSNSQSVEQDLASWHPAHMPESSTPQGINGQLTDNAIKQPLRSHGSDASSPRFIPLEYPSPIDAQESTANTQLTNNTFGSLKSSPKLDSSQIESGDAAQRGFSTGNERGYQGASDIPPFDVTSTEDKQHSEVVNGLSFVGHTFPKDLASSQGTKTAQQHESEDRYNGLTVDQSEDVVQDFGTPARSNSFPPVPPLHQTHNLDSQAHSQSQVERILEEDEEVGGLAQRHLSAGDVQQTDMADQNHGNFFGNLADEDDNDFFGTTVAAEDGDFSISPADEEARFEEGLPLVHSEFPLNQTEPGQEMPGPPLELPREDQTASDQDFFAEGVDLPEEASFFKPAALDRKSTSQVLDSLSYPHDDTHDETAKQNKRPSLDDVSRGGISNTVVSQVVGERSNPTGNSIVEPRDQTDEDLAAMWQAALDDDDLLDDSEALDGPPGPSVDAEATMNQQTSLSPDLQTVYGADGRMQEFGNTRPDQRSSSAVAQDRYSPAPNQHNTASPSYQNQSPANRQQSQVPSIYNLSHSSSAPTGFGKAVLQQPGQSNVPGPSRPGIPKPAQSFADKSKGGYTSPYDLPMDVTRPKRRTNLQQVQNVSNSRTASQPPPPPRSTSMYAIGFASDDQSPPPPLLPGTGTPLPAARPSSSNVRTRPSVGSFFEELPSTKSRPSSTAGKYAPAALQQQSSQLPARPEPPRQPPQGPALASSNNTPNTAPDYQLVPPERHSPYTRLPQQENPSKPPLQANSRYSPAPGASSNVPPPRNRYAASPAGVPRPPAPGQAMPFQPRTSSPLTQNPATSQQPYRKSSLPTDVPERPLTQRSATTQRYVSQDHPPALPQLEEHFEPSVGRNVPGPATEKPTSDSPATHGHIPLAPSTGYDQYRGSPPNHGISAFTPDSGATSASPDPALTQPFERQAESRGSTDEGGFEPPRRSQTQSPGAVRSKPEAFNRTKDVYQRPASATGGMSHIRAEPPASTSYEASNRTEHRSKQELNYIQPMDGREHDPFERWKGAPILKFGFGGTIVTSFPKHIPRYTAGHAFPMVICSPGEVKLQSGNVGTLDNSIAKFPGPLKSKGKKKELIGWLQQKVDALESAQAFVLPSSTLPDPVKRHEEKILLWKTMQILVEYDGTVTHDSKAENAVRAILCPEIVEGDGVESVSTGSGGLLSGISMSGGAQHVAGAANPDAMESIRRLLLQGDREKAVWHAVDRRMWAHAMVLASTLDKSVWKQVLHEFTRLEVKPFGENTEPLAALYEVFAGNWDESIDELVPPSARAGLQMVSKVASTGPTRNALDGLDRWRETLTLILSNRTTDDENALAALGRLLASYGRIEAAHLCLIFAKSTGLFSGTDDAQVSVALLGADHQQQPFDYGRDIDSILLTEVYEFTRSVLASSASLSVSPHLQSYKLYHAMLLAEHGYRSEAQQYCDAIMGTLKATTKPSPYYHSLLFNALDDLVERLQQAPRDGSSWMSKPMDKVSGSMWKKFNNFIVGDESDTASVASGKGDQDAGPFARVTGDASNMSRNPSSTDLYGAYGSQTGPPPPAATAFGSRYAPSGQYTPRSSLEQQSRTSDELHRPSQPSTLRPTQLQPPYSSNPSRYTSSTAYQPEPSSQSYKPSYQPSPYDTTQPGTHLPTPPSQPDSLPIAPSEDPSSSPYPQESYQSSLPSPSQAPQIHAPSFDAPPHSTFEAPSSTYEPANSAYEPPSSYAPYDAEGQDDSSPPSPEKKKSFMDDDDDDAFAARAAAVLKEEKARKDREADDAFRKAAEADAQKDLKPKKSGWFGGVGGWLGGGKKDDNLSQEPKAIKAKLGEESSFYYDKELKQWVNKKGPAPAAAETPKPPPPRGPPSRAVSGASGPPSSMSRTSTPPVPPLPSSMSQAQGGTPPVNVSHPTPPASSFPSGPPSGTGTPARTASPAAMPPTAGAGEQLAPSNGPPSAPPSRPPTAASGAKGIDIDDLLGEPQVRKGGTMRRGKKGRGYVDVMAK
ncbi:MAG: hypothetical protein Q9201_005555 [Fulgogasparrea decipioides]